MPELTGGVSLSANMSYGNLALCRASRMVPDTLFTVPGDIYDVKTHRIVEFRMQAMYSAGHQRKLLASYRQTVFGIDVFERSNFH